MTGNYWPNGQHRIQPLTCGQYNRESKIQIQNTGNVFQLLYNTDDDRVMCPTYGCPENIWESLATPTAIFLRIMNV